jgi:outer membrane lipoprotein carrier protein
MKKLLIVCVCALCYTTQPAMAQNDAKAKEILQNVSKKFSSLKSLKANFSFSITSANGKVNDTKKGTFSLKGTKYHVVLSGQEIICDNKTVWTYTKDTKEVQVSNYNPNEQTISPTKLFSNAYDKDYKYSYKGEQKAQGKSCDVVELIPNDKSKQVGKLDLMIDKATATIVGGTITEKNGNKFQYSVSDFTPNANIPDSYFTFDPKAHPGVEVVDLR